MAGTKRQERFSKTTGFVQKNHPHPVTSCGRRRAYMHGESPLKQKKKYNIGEGFMNPPYRDNVKRQKAGVPFEKRQGYHGYKNFKSNIEHDDQSKEAARKRGELCKKCDNRKGNCKCK